MPKRTIPERYIPKRDGILYTPEQRALRGISLDLDYEAVDTIYYEREQLVLGIDKLLENILLNRSRYLRDGLPSISDEEHRRKSMVDAYQQSGLVKKAVNLGIITDLPTPEEFLEFQRSKISDVLFERALKPPFNGDEAMVARALGSLGVKSINQFCPDS